MITFYDNGCCKAMQPIIDMVAVLFYICVISGVVTFNIFTLVDLILKDKELSSKEDEAYKTDLKTKDKE